jgi:SAM-dependent methyltransferase
MFDSTDPADRHPQTDLDFSTASPGRVYDVWLGGKDNFEADRELALKIAEQVPDIALIARENRAFLQRAVRFLSGQGIERFIDIGCGIPVPPNVHEIAQDLRPGSRVAYIDNDPVVLVHGRALLAHTTGVTVTKGDLTDPAAILAAPAVKALTESGDPVGLLLVAVLHFIPDAKHVVTVLGDALPPGSYLAISHATHRAGLTTATELYNRDAGTLILRDGPQFAELFAGFDPVLPGLVPVTSWHTPAAEQPLPVLAGVAMKAGPGV